MYLEADDDTGNSDLTPSPVAKVIRTLHFYPDRAQAAYADFDRNTWTARLGTGSEASANSTVGVTAEDLPPALTVSAQTDGPLARHDENSLLGVRIDYQVGDVYTKSVLFHGPCAAALTCTMPAAPPRCRGEPSARPTKPSASPTLPASPSRPAPTPRPTGRAASRSRS